MVTRDQSHRLSAAWSVAAQDLGVVVHAPFEYDSAGRRHAAVAYLPDFGGGKGAVVLACGNDPSGAAVRDATALGYWVSKVQVESYSTYSGAPERRPPWFTGRPWR